MNKTIKEYLQTIGSKGGKKSRRTLTTEQAKKMVEIRESKRKTVSELERREAFNKIYIDGD